ncbi:MAG: DUF2934 domain-containing protein [Bryobacteraceae bacterium]|nr:DUF2934 domain-containing protein [Bryobacteraceae bacterium]
MPKRKTADATPEPVVKAKPQKPASTHKLTTTKKAKQPAAVVTNLVTSAVTKVVPAVAPFKPPTHLPTHEDIAQLAWSYSEQRGHHGGSPHEDWLRAERDLTKLAQNR